MAKTVIAYILCISCLLTPVTVTKDIQYTIYVPETPDSVIIYYNCDAQLSHTEKTKLKHPFNFQEGIANKILKGNPNSIIVVTYQYNDKLVKKVNKLIDKYEIKEIIISGWSAGGNNAIRAANALAKKDRNIQLLLIDCNDTNQLGEKYFEILKKYNIPIHYTSNVVTQNKMKVLRKIRNVKLDITFYKLKIPKDYQGSNHIYCRNCAVDYDLYGYLLGLHNLDKHYTLGSYSYKKHKPVF